MSFEEVFHCLWPHKKTPFDRDCRNYVEISSKYNENVYITSCLKLIKYSNLNYITEQVIYEDLRNSFLNVDITSCPKSINLLSITLIP